MATHIALVTTGLPQGGFCKIGDHINYRGPGDWKFEPLDPKAKKAWEEQHSQPERVKDAIDRTPWTQREPDTQPEEHDYILPGYE